jgi:hypothetical protein
MLPNLSRMVEGLGRLSISIPIRQVLKSPSIQFSGDFVDRKTFDDKNAE